MRYLCLIRIDPVAFDALPAATQNQLNADHLDYNDELRQGGKFRTGVAAPAEDIFVQDDCREIAPRQIAAHRFGIDLPRLHKQAVNQGLNIHAPP